MKKERMTEIIASLLIVLFSYAASSKLMVHHTFEQQLSKSPFLHAYAGIIMWAIPAIELIITGLLLFKRTRLMGFYASFFLMFLFTGYIYAMLNYSFDIPCSCGGVLSQMSWHQHLIFNIFFIILALLGIIFQSPDNKVARLLSLNILLRNKQESR